MIGVGNETTGTGTGTEIKTETAIRGVGAAGRAVHQEGAAQTQGDQVCGTNTCSCPIVQQLLLQIDETTDGTRMMTGETGIRVTRVATTETDEIRVGEMGREKNGIDTTGTKGTAKGAEMASVNNRGKANRTPGRIPNPERRESRHNYKVWPPGLHMTDF